MQSFQFNDGNSIPAVGFGTAAIGKWQRDDSYVVDVILQAIKAGYRHIDTASIYGNERSVGQAIRESGVPRSEFFVTTKVWDTQQGNNETQRALEQSLQRLDMDYVDLYLVHWPYPEKTRATWQAMEKGHEQKLIRSLGLSNFRPKDINEVLSFSQVRPVYNQLELHPYLIQQDWLDYCEQKDIRVACWSPLGSGSWSGVETKDKPIADPAILGLADKYSVSAGQIILKWDLQKGRIVIPKAESEKNIRNNLLLNGFTLTEEELLTIDTLNRNHRYGGNPDSALRNNLAMKVPD